MASTSVLRSRPSRPGADWFRDLDGVPSIVLPLGSSERVTMDYTNEISGTDTIRSVAWDANGPVASDTSNDATSATATITGVPGSVKITATLASGRTLVQYVRVMVPPYGARVEGDYDG